MKKTTHKPLNAMSLTIRTESGKCEVIMGLEGCSIMERRFLFNMLQATKQGGSIGFDVQQSAEGEHRLTMLLRRAQVDAAVRQEMQAH